VKNSLAIDQVRETVHNIAKVLNQILFVEEVLTYCSVEDLLLQVIVSNLQNDDLAVLGLLHPAVEGVHLDDVRVITQLISELHFASGRGKILFVIESQEFGSPN